MIFLRFRLAPSDRPTCRAHSAAKQILGRSDRPTDPPTGCWVAADRLGSPDRPTLSECRISPESYVKMCMEIWCHEIVAPPRVRHNKFGAHCGSEGRTYHLSLLLAYRSAYRRIVTQPDRPTCRAQRGEANFGSDRPTDRPSSGQLGLNARVGQPDRPTHCAPQAAQSMTRTTRPTDPLRG